MAISSGLGVSAIKPGVVDSTTRPSSPYEGQMIYETDTNLLRIWNGTAWRTIAASTPSSGSVIQVQNFVTTAGASNATNTAAATTITLSITPTSTTSKILIMGTTGAIVKGNYRTWCDFTIRRNNTTVINSYGYVLDQSTTTSAASFPGQAFNYLDSPATTSSTTYTIYFLSALGNNISIEGGHITLMEIAG